MYYFLSFVSIIIRLNGSLTCEELKDAIHSVMKIVQRSVFSEEYRNLANGKDISLKKIVRFESVLLIETKSFV